MDAALAEPVGILIIGGSETALGYGVNIITRDIDTLGFDERLRAAASEARTATGLDIPVQNAAIADLPGTAGTASAGAHARVPQIELVVVREQFDVMVPHGPPTLRDQGSRAIMRQSAAERVLYAR